MSNNKIKTYRTKEDAFLLIIIELVEKSKYLIYLIDPWKVGIRDYTEYTGPMDNIKTEIGLPGIKFHEISKKETARFLRIGYDIASYYNLDIPEKGLKWLEKLGVLKLDLSGSLYRCFNCETGNLSEEDVQEIISITEEELLKDVIGTDKEEQFFYICDTCREEMHESHEDHEDQKYN